MKKTTKKRTTLSPTELSLVRTTTALMKMATQLRSQPRVEVLPAAPLEKIVELQSQGLTEVTQLGQLGLQPLTLSDVAEAVLSEPVDEARVLIKPTGAVYLPHIEYTRWFNRAFGRAQWQLVPASKPSMNPIPAEPGDKERFLITQEFVLFVHGKPVARALGEQEYHPSNRDQSHGDVVEALNASALRRLAKRLGVGDVLWDRRWTNNFIERYGVKVWVSGSSKPQWRRKDEAPLKGETGVARDREPKGEPSKGEPSRPAEAPKPRANEFITQGTKEKPGQVERLWTIARKAGRTKEELHAWLVTAYNVDSLKKIKRGDYDAIVEAVASSKPLPLPTVVVEQRVATSELKGAFEEITDSDIPWSPRDPGEEG